MFGDLTFAGVTPYATFDTGDVPTPNLISWNVVCPDDSTWQSIDPKNNITNNICESE